MSKHTAPKKLAIKKRCLYLTSQYFPYDNIEAILSEEFSISSSMARKTIAAVKKDLQEAYSIDVGDKRNRMILSLENDLREAQAMYKEKKTTAWFNLILVVKDKLASFEHNNLQPKEETLDKKPTEININLVKYDK